MAGELEMRSEIRKLRLAASVAWTREDEFDHEDLLKKSWKLIPQYRGVYQLFFEKLLGKEFLAPLPEDEELCKQADFLRFWEDVFTKYSSSRMFVCYPYHPHGVEGLLMRHSLQLNNPSSLDARKIAMLSGG
jgi:hypothetical protein